MFPESSAALVSWEGGFFLDLDGGCLVTGFTVLGEKMSSVQRESMSSRCFSSTWWHCKNVCVRMPIFVCGKFQRACWKLEEQQTMQDILKYVLRKHPPIWSWKMDLVSAFLDFFSFGFEVDVISAKMSTLSSNRLASKDFSLCFLGGVAASSCENGNRHIQTRSRQTHARANTHFPRNILISLYLLLQRSWLLDKQTCWPSMLCDRPTALTLL